MYFISPGIAALESKHKSLFEYNFGNIIENLETTLKNKFQLNSFRLGQREIVGSVLAGRDVLAVMPTGGGKSLCYQLQAYMRPGLTLVVSPLIALMNDQVQALKTLGLPAGCVHSGMDESEKRQVFNDIQSNDSFILYLSPERVQKPGFLDWIRRQKLNLFAIDEAHCVSQWGHDFRPEYSQLSSLRRARPDVPVMGLTATATPLVKNDIIEHLALNNPDQHVYGFYRPNLYYQVEYCESEVQREKFVLQAIRQNPYGRILIYCGTRKKAQAWSKLLKAQKESVGYYHAGLSAEKREQIERKYHLGKIRILAATNAFGMGIDHPDVRLVVHTQMPGNIESYYQEVGRAGRDGLEATCLMTYSRKDKGLHSFFIRESDAPQKIKNHRWQALDSIVNYAEGSECRHGDILTYFRDQKRISKCGHCDSCDPRSERRVVLPATIRKIQEKPQKSERKKKSIDVDDASLTPQDVLKLELLREWRRNYAKERDIPAFMVFGDKTLKDLILKSPQTEEDLKSIYGLGQKKISIFGKELMAQLALSR